MTSAGSPTLMGATRWPDTSSPHPLTRVLRAKAPLRVSFAGGGTDVSPFPEREGGCVLSATIDRYAYGTLRSRRDGKICIESADFGISLSFARGESLPLDGELSLVKAAIGRIRGARDHSGYDIFLHSGAPPGSGLGSSSTVVVAMIGLLKDYHGLILDDYEIAELAYQVERRDLGIRGGMQDQYAAAFGGFNFIEFLDDRVIVNPLRIPSQAMNELEHNLLLAYTGGTRFSDHIIDDQVARFEADDPNTLAGLRRGKELATEMKDALLRGHLNAFGELLGESWEYKKRMSPRITTGRIDEAYETACRHGALGGKVTGAGGGGYMLFYCRFERRHHVADALIRLGLTVEPFRFELGGLSTWTASDA